MAADKTPAAQRHSNEGESVRHLVDLGYVDPQEVVAREAARRREVQSRFQQANELNREGRRGEAVALLQSLSDADPEWAAPHQLLAEIHYAAGQWSEAQRQLEWLAHHGVDSPRVALLRGALALARRELRPALDELEYARFAEPNLPSLHTLLGTVFQRLGRWNDAEDAFREAVQQNPSDARARDGLAAVHLQHAEYEDAADWALRALEQDMRHCRAHYHLGIALAQLNRGEEALAALETAARLDPTRAAPYYWLSRIASAQLHDAARCAAYREQARRIIRQRRHERASR